jgi:hypothetical protein
MWQIHGEKDCVLTWGDLMDVGKRSMKYGVKVYHEKSAEVIVLGVGDDAKEGLNFRR